MPSDERGASTDAGNMPSDATPPVHRESRVRALLGLPDDAGENLVRLPLRLPVGLRYAEAASIDEPDPMGPSFIEHWPQGGLVEDGSSPPLMEETVIDTPNVSGGQPDYIVAEEMRQNEERARPSPVQPVQEPSANPVEAPSPSRLEIPGVSEMPTAFPALSEEIASEQLAAPSEPRVPASPPPPSPLADESNFETPENLVENPKPSRPEIPPAAAALSGEMAIEQSVERSEPRVPASPPPPPPLADESNFETLVQAIETPSPSRSEIADVSEMPTAFPALSEEVASEQLAAPSEPRPPASSPPLPPLADEPDFGTPRQAVEAPKPAQSEMLTAQPDLSGKMAADQPTGRVLSPIDPIAPPERTPEPSPHLMEADRKHLTATSTPLVPEHAATGDGGTAGRAEKTPGNHGAGIGSFRPIDMPAGRIPGRQADDERIEQLQQTVYDLTSKLASLQTQVSRQTQREPRHAGNSHSERSPGRSESPTPPQPVVIIKRSGHPDRPTHAFWARRYLGRLHRRPLR